tara:strand:+ start:225 stop:1547 length:1323 start_codon:yes stop_codon:yes gene_type:complete
MIISSEYTIKKFKISYVTQNYLKWFKDPLTKKFIITKCQTISELKKDVRIRLQEKNSLFYGIFTKKNFHIGNIFVNKIDIKKGNAYLGILIGEKEFRGKGVGYIAIKSVINLLNRNYGLNNIFLGLSKKNKIAYKLYSKIGFRKIKSKTTNQSITMEYNFLKEKFILGSAQLGNVYGITNSSKNSLSKKKIKKILSFSKKIGINHLDTADGYNFDTSLLSSNFWKLDTKIQINDKNTDYNKVLKYIKSFNKQKVKLETVYIHNPEKIFSKNGKKIMEILAGLKRKKLIKNIGISAYSYNIVAKIVSNFKIDVVQVPFNILDRRFEKKFKLLKNKKIKIYVRSIFLQGFLISNKEKFLRSKYLKNFISFSRKNSIKRLDLCLDFVKQNKFIDKLIIGVLNVKQIKQIVNSRTKRKIIYTKKISTGNLNIIDPRKWSDQTFI